MIRKSIGIALCLAGVLFAVVGILKGQNPVAVTAIAACATFWGGYLAASRK